MKKYNTKKYLDNTGLKVLNKKVRKKTNMFIPKLFIALSFFRVGYGIVLNKMTKEPDKPFNDEQKIPDNNDFYEQMELKLAKESYLNLTNLLKNNAKNYNVNLKDFELYNIAFDEVSENVVFVFTKENNFVNLKYNISSKDLVNSLTNSKNLSEQFSEIYKLVKNTALKNIPTIQTISEYELNIYKNLYDNFTPISITEEEISLGSERKTNPPNFITGRDYVYLTIYGSVQNDNEYYTSITLAINKDDYDILEIENFNDFILNNLNNKKIIKNIINEKNNKIINKLNNDIKNIKNAKNTIDMGSYTIK